MTKIHEGNFSEITARPHTRSSKNNRHRSQSSINILSPSIIKLREIYKFTHRELECILCSIYGQSARQASADLGLSQRTVEEYLNNAKKKIGAKSKSILIQRCITTLLCKD